jgi:2-keto-4-pentenoate hydratase/2-oxohepta-3-ene-1,7-dioic acid hydratase in catechol pathway
VFGIGLNYRAHAAESGIPLPDRPATFTKFPTCIVGPRADVGLPSAAVDWEVELVVVIGARAHRVTEADAWTHVAGLTVGQDISERVVQWSGGGQFSLGKSFPTFGPMGPWLVTPDELADRNDLELSCNVNGEEMQRSRTSDMGFTVSQLIAELSAILPLLR